MPFLSARKVFACRTLSVTGGALLLACSASAAVPVNPEALVRHGVAYRLAEEAHHQPLRFVFYKKDNGHSFTRYIVQTPDQGDVARLVAVNGKPLTAAGSQAEVDRLHTLAATPALQQHRLRHEKADQARINKLLRLLPAAFVYRYVDTVPCHVDSPPVVPIPGVPVQPAAAPGAASECYHLTFTPNPQWNPPDLESRIFTGMAGDVWIETHDERLHRLTAHLMSDVDFGWGIIGRLNRGGTVFLEQDRIAPADWELTRMRLHLDGKALLVKSLRIHINETMGNFQRVPANLDYQQAIKMLLASPPLPGR